MNFYQELFWTSQTMWGLDAWVTKWLVNSLRPSDAYMRQLTNHHWFRWWLVTWPAPNHYLNQCWNIVNWTIRNKLQWNLNRNSNIFIQENAFESVICEMAAILSQPQCVNTFRLGLNSCSFRCIFFCKSNHILIQISLKIVLKDPNDS